MRLVQVEAGRHVCMCHCSTIDNAVKHWNAARGADW